MALGQEGGSKYSMTESLKLERGKVELGVGNPRPSRPLYGTLWTRVCQLKYLTVCLALLGANKARLTKTRINSLVAKTDARISL